MSPWQGPSRVRIFLAGSFYPFQPLVMWPSAPCTEGGCLGLLLAISVSFTTAHHHPLVTCALVYLSAVCPLNQSTNCRWGSALLGSGISPTLGWAHGDEQRD